ncbi:MAG: alpha/beta hydrolase [Anditalea sp.]
MKQLIYKSLGLYLNTLTRIAPEKGGKLGFKIFCTPKKKKLKREHLDFLHSANLGDFDFNGQNIKIYEWGTGPKKVLFVHGWQSHSFRWKKYIEAFPKDEYTLIAFDAPAHGLSDGKQFTVPHNAYLMALLARYYHGFNAVVSHSIGSFSFFYAMAKYDLPPIRKLVAMASPGKAREFFTFYIEALKLKSSTMARIKNEFQQYVKEELDNINLSVMIENLSVPGLIIHDRDDTQTGYQNALELRDNWKGSTLHTTQGLGHNLRSGEVVQLVADFVKENPLEFADF